MYPDSDGPASRIGFHSGQATSTSYSNLTEPKGLTTPKDIVFTWQCWEKIISLRDAHSSTEVGFLMVRNPDDMFIIEDIVVPKQQVSGASVRFDPDSINDIKAAMYAAGTLKLLLPGWGHTHPGGSASPSGTDKDTFSDSYAQGPYAFMFIAGKGTNADYTCAFRIHLPDIKSYVELPLKVLTFNNPVQETYKEHSARIAAIRQYADFLDGLPAWLTSVNTQITSGYTPYNYSSNKGVTHSEQPKPTHYLPPGPSENSPTSAPDSTQVDRSILTATQQEGKQVFTDRNGNIFDWDDANGTLEQRPPSQTPSPSLEQALSIVSGITDKMDTNNTPSAMKLSDYKAAKEIAEDLHKYAPMVDGQLRPMVHLQDTEYNLADDMYEWNWKHYMHLPKHSRQRVDIVLADEFGFRCDQHGLIKI